MKKIFWVLLFVACAGCVTVKIPKYLNDKLPYTKKFYSSFENTMSATQQALKDTGWRVTEIANPSVFEQGQAASEQQGKQALLFTEIRQTPLILVSRYMSLNVYVRSADDGTDVEVRYISVVPIVFKSVENYKNDGVVNKIFDRIAELLEK